MAIWNRNRRARQNELNGALAKCRPYFIGCAAFSAGISILYLTPSIYMFQIFDRVIQTGSEATLLMLSAAAIIGLMTMAALDDVRARVMVRASVRFDHILAKRVISALVERGAMPGGKGTDSQALRDLDSIRAFLSSQTLHAIFDLPWLPMFLLIIFMLAPQLGWFGVIGTTIIIGIALLNEYAVRSSVLAGQRVSVRNYADTSSLLNNAEVVQAMGMQAGLLQRWARDRAWLQAFNAQSADRTALMQSMTRFFRYFLQMGMMGFGAYLVIERDITPGAMFAASMLMARAVHPIDVLTSGWRQLVLARESYQRVNMLLNQTLPPQSRMSLPQPNGMLTVERISFAPDNADKYIINGIAFTLQPGESLGIIGPSAAGKSTLARVLVGVWRPSIGHVRLDGADIHEWDRTEFGRHAGYLPQDVELFAGTVRDNISRFTNAPAELVVDAARLAGVHEMIMRLPNGYDTEIGEGGAILSGGQRQRIGLARALFGNPKLLVLDEPNASLDADGEAALVTALQEIKARGCTVVLIAHRQSVLQAVDKLLVLRAGKQEMFGTRDEVVAKIMPPRTPPRPVAIRGGAASEERKGAGVSS